MHSVEKMHVFGSQANDSFSDISDLDLLVKFSDSINILDYSDNYFDLHEKLEHLFQMKVDLIAERSLRNPILIQEIDRTKIALV